MLKTIHINKQWRAAAANVFKSEYYDDVESEVRFLFYSLLNLLITFRC